MFHSEQEYESRYAIVLCIEEVLRLATGSRWSSLITSSARSDLSSCRHMARTSSPQECLKPCIFSPAIVEEHRLNGLFWAFIEVVARAYWRDRQLRAIWLLWDPSIPSLSGSISNKLKSVSDKFCVGCRDEWGGFCWGDFWAAYMRGLYSIV